jgi:hypothetical protein
MDVLGCVDAGDDGIGLGKLQTLPGQLRPVVHGLGVVKQL